MSSIATYLNQILRSVYGKDVRQAIHDAISECYDDVNAPALQTEAMQAAVQAKIDAGEMAALTLADGSVTGAKLADGTITAGKIATGVIPAVDATLTTEGAAADAKAVGDAIEDVRKHTGSYTVPNLYDKDNKVGTMTINGTSVSGLSNWIPIRQGVTYSTDYTSTQFYFFDTEKNYLSAITLISTINRIRPNADGYLLIRTKGADKTVVEGTYLEYAEGVKSRWNGKKWLALGDSITTSGASWAVHGYPYYVGSYLGINVTNVASGGKVMSYYFSPDNLIDTYADDYDLVTVMLGTNNQGYNCGIGALNDGYYQQGNYASNASFYAQTQHLVDLLQAKYPNAIIAFFTPLRRSESASDGTYKVNTLGLTTEAYANAVKAVCEYYNIPCLDLYTQNIDPKFGWIRAAYFCNGDGTHPNDAGHKRYTAPAIADFLERLAPFDDVETGEEEAET